ncbi:MAG: transporter [Gemmatimonadetes bacterium]|nr:MAG: transporter [Gemmatimonadota bacterium]
MTTVAPITTTAGRARERRLPAYLLAGVAFGIVLTKGELVSWFRIQEALRFKGLYLYEVFASALAVTIPAFALLKRRAVRSLSGEPIAIPPKVLGRGYRYVIGGLIFGLGWGLLGACPGPIFALIGAGVGPMVVVSLAAVAGTWVYGYLRPSLPH